jgi:hypothetical protein
MGDKSPLTLQTGSAQIGLEEVAAGEADHGAVLFTATFSLTVQIFNMLMAVVTRFFIQFE